MIKFKTILLFLVIIFGVTSPLPKGFVYVDTIIPNIDVELRYNSDHNFVGERIAGYHSNKLILTLETALALKQVQEELLSKNLCLLVYDGYRPQQAVNHFIEWAKKLEDTVQKQKFYPHVAKENLFTEGYIATRSGHSKGSTVDVTIIDGKTNEPLDMGSDYDFFGEASWIHYEKISETQKANRQLLQNVMLKHGFKNFFKEWWHFTLINEPFPNTYFDFPVE